MTIAQIAAYASVIVALAASVASALCALKASRAAKQVHSMTSLQGELIDIRDYMAKLDKWAKRINSRETMQERRASQNSANEHDPSSTPATNSKDELRRRAGLIAGQPARHRESH